MVSPELILLAHGYLFSVLPPFFWISLDLRADSNRSFTPGPMSGMPDPQKFSVSPGPGCSEGTVCLAASGGGCLCSWPWQRKGEEVEIVMFCTLVQTASHTVLSFWGNNDFADSLKWCPGPHPNTPEHLLGKCILSAADKGWVLPWRTLWPSWEEPPWIKWECLGNISATRGRCCRTECWCEPGKKHPGRFVALWQRFTGKVHFGKVLEFPFSGSGLGTDCLPHPVYWCCRMTNLTF